MVFILKYGSRSKWHRSFAQLEKLVLWHSTWLSYFFSFQIYRWDPFVKCVLINTHSNQNKDVFFLFLYLQPCVLMPLLWIREERQQNAALFLRKPLINFRKIFFLLWAALGPVCFWSGYISGKRAVLQETENKLSVKRESFVLCFWQKMFQSLSSHVVKTGLPMTALQLGGAAEQLVLWKRCDLTSGSCSGFAGAEPKYH